MASSQQHGFEEPGDVPDIRPVVDTIPTLAWSAGPDGSADFFNQRWLDYTSLSSKQALGSGWDAAKQLVPENSEIDLFQLDEIPMFKEDDESHPASSMLELKKRIRRAHALLLVTPEYKLLHPGSLEERDRLGLSAPWR
jgi:NADPH-dependent FMN reductase